jgi:hypothetical protein
VGLVNDLSGVAVDSRGEPGGQGAEAAAAWPNGFGRLWRCCGSREKVIGVFPGLTSTVITAGSLIRRPWASCRWGARPAKRP